MTWVKNVGFWLSIHSTERLFPPQEKPIVLTSTFLPTPQSKTGKTQGRVTRELCPLTSGAFNDLSISRSEIRHLVFSFLPLSCSFFSPNETQYHNEWRGNLFPPLLTAQPANQEINKNGGFQGGHHQPRQKRNGGAQAPRMSAVLSAGGGATRVPAVSWKSGCRPHRRRPPESKTKPPGRGPGTRTSLTDATSLETASLVNKQRV